MNGYFIALEGPEGAGKSTQARLLADRLGTLGYAALVTREPGGTAVGELIRAILLDPEGCAILPETEALLYAAARAQHVREVLRPAMTAGRVIVCDRYLDSSLAYQGGGHGLDLDHLRAVQVFATDGLAPDLRVLLDLPVERGLARRFAGTTAISRVDQAGSAFHDRVRAFYLYLAASDPTNWIVTHADRGVDVIAEELCGSVLDRLRRAGVMPAGLDDRRVTSRAGGVR